MISQSTAPLSPTVTRLDDKLSPNKASIRTSLDLKGFKLENVFHKDGEGGGNTKKFFGKMFKKKNAGENPPLGSAYRQQQLQPPPKQSPSQSFSSFENVPPPNPGSGEKIPPPQTGGPASHVKAPSMATIGPGDSYIGNPTFGLAPIVQRRVSGSLIVNNGGAVTGLSGTNPSSSNNTSSLGFGLPATLSPSKPDLSNQANTFIPIIPSSRPIGYTWTVRKWAKKNSEGWAAHIVAAAAAGLDLVHGAGNLDGDEEVVVFEWVKLRSPGHGTGFGGQGSALTRFATGDTNVSSITAGTGASRARSKSRGPSGLSHQASDSHDQTQAQTRNLKPSSSSNSHQDHSAESKLSLTLQLPSSRSASPSLAAYPHPSPNLDGRPWPVRRTSASASPSPRRPSSPSILSTHTLENNLGSRDHDPDQDQDHGHEHEHETGSCTDGTGTINGDMTAEEDEGEGEEESDPEDSETPWTCSVWVKKTGHRQLLGTLTPAPHHPKVIAMLKIPHNLQTVALAEVSGVAAGTAPNLIKPDLVNKIKEDIALSEENLKDVVCVTAMWLVAREEFGGLGRRKKKI